MILFIEPHYDDFVLSAGMYSLYRLASPVDKLVTVFKGKNNSSGSRALCEDLGKKYEDLGFPNIDWKSPNILFNPKDFKSALDSQVKNATTILVTLGVGNYAHSFLSHFIIKNYVSRHMVLFFRDLPHSYDSTKLNHIPFEEHIKDFKLVETFGTDDLYNKKLELFKKYYPSQKSLLWFEREQFVNPIKEEIYEYLPNKSFF